MVDEAQKSDLVDITVRRHAETAKAILVSDTGARKDAVWLPKSKVEFYTGTRQNIVNVRLPEWLAKEKGLI